MGNCCRVAVTTAEKTAFEAQGFKVVKHLPCLGGACDQEHQIWCGCPMWEGEWQMEKS